jgi:hypothetical protein
VFKSPRWAFFERNYLEMAAIVGFCMFCLTWVLFHGIGGITISPVWSSLISGLVGSVVGAILVIWAQRTDKKAADEKRAIVFARMLMVESTQLAGTGLLTFAYIWTGTGKVENLHYPVLIQVSQQPDVLPANISETALRFFGLVTDLEVALNAFRTSEWGLQAKTVSTPAKRALQCWALLHQQLNDSFGQSLELPALPPDEEALTKLVDLGFRSA